MLLGIEALDLSAPSEGRIQVGVRLGNGKELTLYAATPEAPATWVAEKGFTWGVPLLFVRGLDEGSVRAAVDVMAADLSGYWLSYNARAARQRPEEAAPSPLKVAVVELSDREPDGDRSNGSAVAHATLTDGREFSVLAATPAWFAKAFSELGLPYYWGPSILFLAKLEKAPAKRAVEEMLARGDRWLCLYDTPRTTLPKVLSEFKARRE